ncbi:MAG: folylpolyglutamate synthase/dihydrofolate synthase family protein [Candidatus Lernaella stagnicola]|nr:folylpolyglutamate synthase/dihydrofolate synthase family protein [Candidatus Lernaella stagnicola]
MNEAYRQRVERLFDLQRFGIKLGLKNIARLLRDLGDPRPGKRVVIVGGTNGKGSTSAMLASIGQAAGLKTGLFTSPHLVSFTERIQINGERIKPTDVVELADHLWDTLEPYRVAGEPEPITFFEMLTAMAALYFSRQNVDLAIMEVGLGGRLDATNALPRDLVVLTDIYLDHQQYLGDTIDAIARDKASLLRTGVPAIATGGADGAIEPIVEVAAEVGAPLQVMVRDFQEDRSQRTKSIPQWSNGRYVLHDLPVPLAGGDIQFRNTSAAIAAAVTLGIHDEDTIRRGLAATRWPGRAELFDGPPRWFLDCAHNPAGATMLLHEWPAADRVVWLFAGMKDKDLAGIAATLAPHVSSVVCTELPMPRAATAEDLAAHVRPYNENVTVVTDPDAAMSAAADAAGPTGLAMAAGSIFLVGHVRGRLTGETGP